MRKKSILIISICLIGLIAMGIGVYVYMMGGATIRSSSKWNSIISILIDVDILIVLSIVSFRNIKRLINKEKHN